ncbi:MAG: hypothetical protein ACE5JE_04310 [Thermoplasmata archaeon]
MRVQQNGQVFPVYSIRILWVALLTYGASAFLFAASAGLFAAVVAIRGGPSGILLCSLANVLAVVGGVTLGIAVVLLIRSYRRPAQGGLRLERHVVVGEASARTTQMVWWTFVGALVPVAILLYFARTSAFEATQATLGTFSGIAALSFLISVSVLALRGHHRQDGAVHRRFAGAVALGSVGIIGQIVLLLPPMIRSPSWITLGGLPLIDWNLPFGALVGTSAVLLSLLYRSLARRVQ